MKPTQDLLFGIYPHYSRGNLSFMEDNDYLYAIPQKETNLTIGISETNYYILLNTQEPISRLADIVYRVFLFINTAIGIFALIFVIYKFAIIPLKNVEQNF